MSLQFFNGVTLIHQFGPWKKERAIVVKSGEVEIYVKNDHNLPDSDETSWTKDSSTYGEDTHFIKTQNLKLKIVPNEGSFSIDLNEEQ